MAPVEGAVISIAPGLYPEVLKIDKPNIRLRSPCSDPTKTVIVFDNSAGASGGTSKSATVSGDNFTAENLTFSNDFNRTHPQLPQGSQALAINVTGDRAVFRNMRFLGNQDTVYAAKSRQYFVNCCIEGNVDFVFGDARAVFENCEIHSNRKVGDTSQRRVNATPRRTNGYVFNHCKLTGEPGEEHVWPGRPWREWHPGETKYVEAVHYAEFNSTGPEREPHTRKLTAGEVAQKRYLAGKDNWDPTIKRQAACPLHSTGRTSLSFLNLRQ